MNKTLILDCHGGDNSPECVIFGADIAAKTCDVNYVFVGNEQKINASLNTCSLSSERYRIVNADDIITMEDEPTSILKQKSGSSMATALKLLAAGEGDAVISAGNSGALLTGATLFVKRIKGVKRAAFSPVLPSQDGIFLLIDAGSNVQCTPEMLYQFGVLGSVYAEHVLNIKNPRVALLNNGTEDCKGTPLQEEANNLLKTANINYIGNTEAPAVLKGKCDVLVTDGFSGNIFLKTMEATAYVFGKALKGIFYKSYKNKLAALAIKSDINAFKKRISGDEQGGAPLLGISKPVFKAHGNSDKMAYSYAIKDALSYILNDVSTKLTSAFEQNDKI